MIHDDKGGSIVNGKSLGQNIRATREKYGISLAKLADLVELPHRTMSLVEAGVSEKSFIEYHLPKIAEALGTTVRALKNEELPSERSIRGELQELLDTGELRGNEELESVLALATADIRQRNNAGIPLSREELLILRDVSRANDGN